MNTAPAPALLRFHAARYADSAGHVAFMAPWWGVPPEDPSSLNCGQFDAWSKAVDLPFELTGDPGQADFFVLTIPWKTVSTSAAAQAFAQEQIDLAARFGKRVVIFFESDHDAPVPWPAHAVVFRFSIYADTRHPCEFAIPPFGQDLLQQCCDGNLQPRTLQARPSVSFCGYAPPLGCRPSRNTVQEWLRYFLYRAGRLARQRRGWIKHAARVQAIRALRGRPGIATRFILRDQFAFNRWGVLQPGGTAESARQQRDEFVDNLVGADYALCARGIANCSIRLYESISVGRLPLLIDTQCVLPYDFICDWRSFCLVVDEKDLPQLAQQLQQFHAKLTPAAFMARQLSARQAFCSWIAPEGFFRQLPRHWLADWSPALPTENTVD